MIFRESRLRGVYELEVERIEDERGFFARSFCRDEFTQHGLETRIAQSSISYSSRMGTLRGMHYQVEPRQECKLVRCTSGSIHDVVIDLRPGSPTYREHVGIRLTRENRRMIYVPAGFAHGFITLQDDTEVHYQISEFYSPEHSRGVRWNDPAFGIEWPERVVVISERDRNFPDFEGETG